jgi:hypothetical protein
MRSTFWSRDTRSAHDVSMTEDDGVVGSGEHGEETKP